MMQVTLAALYGEKGKELAEVIQRCTDLVHASPLRRVFRPYRIEQVHGTLAGMEKLAGYHAHFNANPWAKTGREKVPMKFEPLFDLVRKHFPMTFQFGGFPRAFTQFASVGQRPYERSFQVQWGSNRVTLVAWPNRSGDFTSTRLLSRFRDEVAAECGIRHKYDNDNDLFMALGEITGLAGFPDDEIATLKQQSGKVEESVRDVLLNHRTEITLEPDDIFVVQYENETLPLAGTKAYRITDPGLSAAVIGSLYGNAG